MEHDRSVGKYQNAFWEWLVRDNLDCMPPIYYKEYMKGNIFEFDYLKNLESLISSILAIHIVR